jgi:hypothetical protein
VLLASSFTDSLGLIAVFLVLFPLIVNGIVVFIAVQVIGERRANQNARYDRAPRE